MTPKPRLDSELVRRGLAHSREFARTLIEDRRVLLNGNRAEKPATQVGPDASIVVISEDGAVDYVSRGGYKLSGALDAFSSIKVEGRIALDAGASTGGFTDVLLRRGAAHVIAVDVGYGQLAWSLRTDPRVEIHDRTNVRSLTLNDIGKPVDLVVADLSFISLNLVIPAFAEITHTESDLLLMVKPQFEVGRERLGAGGVVRDSHLRVDAVMGVVKAASDHGLGAVGVTASPLPGPAGNVEYFIWCKHGQTQIGATEIESAVAAGPK
ncbi:MAG TPA: TlyA family RNA methyltransferase [Candidatus Nanopelagicaceae bacterium]|nr:TlyA family RNA methyltransferase [Candidatus Nanopelagicaceae bacterium]